jgi:hypothetical protein
VMVDSRPRTRLHFKNAAHEADVIPRSGAIAARRSEPGV